MSPAPPTPISRIDGDLAGPRAARSLASRGDRLASTPGGRAWFEVAALEPERFLGLRATIDLRTGRPFDPTGPRPRSYVDSLWGFHLTEGPGGRTRLVVSGYASARPRLLQALADVLFWEPAHWVMQTRQFANLRRRAEQREAGLGRRAGQLDRARVHHARFGSHGSDAGRRPQRGNHGVDLGGLHSPIRSADPDVQSIVQVDAKRLIQVAVDPDADERGADTNDRCGGQLGDQNGARESM